MHYSDVKKLIQDELNNRELKNPSIRLNALENIENLLLKEIEEMRLNPLKLIEKTSKSELKKILAKHKSNSKLNGAEESVINELYYRI